VLSGPALVAPGSDFRKTALRAGSAMKEIGKFLAIDHQHGGLD
jgi:hypothetical protein